MILFVCLVRSPMRSIDIRNTFIRFFQQRGHTYVPAAPVINRTDPALMFTNAGMNQFKAFFLDPKKAPHPRVVGVQPCLRVSGKHNDLEQVGVDTYHHTLFEMLGNWSFGDYAKKEAIQWAWELLTNVYQLSPERLYVTVFKGCSQEQLLLDQEAFAYWECHVEADHILPFAKQENFWSMGETGPCGPSTEIHIDLRSPAERRRVSGKSLVNQGHPQVIELWNLVFMQYDRRTTGELVPLSVMHVDTGLGLERLAVALQMRTDSYDTDTFTPLVQTLVTDSGKSFRQDDSSDTAIRVIVDHIRAITFAIADGQPPSNVKAGYVIRRLLRRAVRYGYTYLGYTAPFLYRLVAVLAQQLEVIYPHLVAQRSHIEQLVKAEELSFFATLTKGLSRLNQLLKASSHKSRVLSGSLAFELYDTYGFPLDLTLLIAKEHGFAVDQTDFDAALQQQRERARQATMVAQGDWTSILDSDTSSFVGYDQLEALVRIVKYRVVQVHQETRYQVVLHQTPFYPEGGGQVGDTGKLIGDGESVVVLATYREHGLIIHDLASLPQVVTTPLRAIVDKERRRAITSNHTATHLLHAVLKQLLGTHVVQRGSLVDAQSFRFDFSHTAALSRATLTQIEYAVNQKIRENLMREEKRDLSLAIAQRMGATALFEEKYGEIVRVITFGAKFSVELCGGTHVPYTGHIGNFRIISSTSIASGVYRIVAVTAEHAEKWIHERMSVLYTLNRLLKCPQDTLGAIERLLREKKILTQQVAHYEALQIREKVEQLCDTVQFIGPMPTIIAPIVLSNVAMCSKVAQSLSKKKHCVVILVAAITQKTYIFVSLAKDLAQRYALSAPAIIQHLVPLIHGKGGGTACTATASGQDIKDLNTVLAAASTFLGTHVQNNPSDH